LLEEIPSRTHTTTNVGEDAGNKEHSYTAGGNVQALWKIAWMLLKKLKIDLPYEPSISLLQIYLKEYNSG
jgi:hypothetical protein